MDQFEREIATANDHLCWESGERCRAKPFTVGRFNDQRRAVIDLARKSSPINGSSARTMRGIEK
jgi:hypothetical protein